MVFQEVKEKIYEIYKDYDLDYSYGFVNGMIYGAFVWGDLTRDEMALLNQINLQKFQSDKTRFL